MTDMTGFAALYAEHLPAARRTALAMVPADAADDVTAEAFARVYAVMRTGAVREFRPYLLAAVRNVARTWLAERARTVPVAVPEPRGSAPAAGELAARRAELAMVARAFGSLPQRWRAVLWQTEVEGRSPAELAAGAGMSPNAVAQLSSRARVGLAVAWQRERGTQERVTGPLPALRKIAERGNFRNTA
jgi:RNA polymerase sigma factor (sigma-70 family)